MAESLPIMVFPDYIKLTLSNILKSEGFEHFSYENSAGSRRGDGFLSHMVRVTVNGTRFDSSVNEQIILMVKLKLENDKAIENFNSKFVYDREAHFYNTVIRVFKEFQSNRGLGVDEGFIEYPKCYRALVDNSANKYAIIMEDLAASGYKMLDKLKPNDIHHTSLFMKALGKLHAVSFAMKDQDPGVFQQFKPLNDIFIAKIIENSGLIQGVFNKSLTAALNALLPEEIKEREIMANIKDTYLSILKDAVSAERAEPFAVINHGDCWNNNMMFKYENDSGIPQKICLLDWQIHRYSSPVLDVLVYIFISTEKKFRDNHFEELLKSYHTSVSDTIKMLGSDPEKLFSWNDFQDQLNKFGVFSLVLAPVLLQMVTAKPENIPDLDVIAKNEQSANEEENVPNIIYNERVTDVIRDCVRLGYY